MTTQWFEEWFDSPLYEILYADRNEAEAARLAGLIEELIPPDRYPELLDLGCGRGRHSLTLAGRGYRVTGLDLSEASIETARRKALEQGLKEIRFLVGDMRDPLPQTFDAILNLFTSFGYFDEDAENVRTLASVKAMLRKEGLFLMDYLNAGWVRSTYEPAGEGEYRGVRYRIERYIEEGTIHKKIQFEGKGLPRPRTYVEKVKLYDLEWFEAAFGAYGFETEQLFGGYDGQAYDPVRSSRLVMLVRNRS